MGLQHLDEQGHDGLRPGATSKPSPHRSPSHRAIVPCSDVCIYGCVQAPDPRTPSFPVHLRLMGIPSPSCLPNGTTLAIMLPYDKTINHSLIHLWAVSPHHNFFRQHEYVQHHKHMEMCSTFKICIFYNGTHPHPSMVPDQRWCGMLRLGHSHYARQAPPNSHQKFLSYSECEPSLAARVWLAPVAPVRTSALATMVSYSYLFLLFLLIMLTTDQLKVIWGHKAE